MQPDLKVIWILAIGLSCACLFGYIAQRLKLSPILGYLLAGFIMGPHFPGYVADAYISEQLAYIGVTLLMFAVGLQFSWKDIIDVKKIVLPGAISLALLSILLGFLLSISLGETARAGLIIGAAICVSSTVVIVKVLADQELLHTPQGHIVVGWTIVEDLIAIFVLILLPTLTLPIAARDGSVLNLFSSLGIVVLKIVGLGIFVYFLGGKLIRILLKYVARTRSHELFTLLILSVVFVIAIVSSSFFGVSLALGAFIAGTVVAKSHVSQQAAANALPMRDTFAVVFFLSIGMLFNPIAVLNNLPLFFGTLFIILILRTVLAFSIVKLMKYPLAVALTVAIAIGQIGEYSFMLIEEGDRLNILPHNAYDIIVACALISIALNPILFQFFKRFTSQRLTTDPITDLSPPPKATWKRKAIVVGFGPIGQAAVQCLQDHGYDVLIIDRNVDCVEQLKQLHFEALFGDATQLQLMEMAHLKTRELIVTTTPDLQVTQAIIQTAQHLNPDIKIISRVHWKEDLKHFENADIPVVCDEEVSAQGLVNVILKYINRKPPRFI